VAGARPAPTALRAARARSRRRHDHHPAPADPHPHRHPHPPHPGEVDLPTRGRPCAWSTSRQMVGLAGGGEQDPGGGTMKAKDLPALAVPVGVVGIVLLLVVPLPAALLDFLIVMNITLSLVVLLTSMY